MKIVFVCTGNACRSAAAEVVLKKMIEDNGIKDVEVSSCGTKVHGYLERDEVMFKIAMKKDMQWKAWQCKRQKNCSMLPTSHLLRHHRAWMQGNNQKI